MSLPTSTCFLLIAVLNSIQMAFACNGSQILCEKRYNEITYPTTHNAQSYIATFSLPQELYFSPFEWLKSLSFYLNMNVNNQDLSLSRQLNQGITAMKLRVMVADQIPFVCHGITDRIKSRINVHLCENLPFYTIRKNCNKQLAVTNPCIVDPSAKPLVEVFKEIRAYLVKHPSDILTVFLENYFNDFPLLFATLQDSGLSSYTYHQRPDQAWPKLKEMITSNRRLVIFINTELDDYGKKVEDFPAFNKFQDFVWSSRYQFTTIDELLQDDPNTNDLTAKAFVERRKKPQNKLWVLQHFITPTLAGNPYMALQVNKASVLQTRIKKYQKLLGAKPNFIWVDFYELPKDEPGYLDIIRQLNQN